MIVLNSLIAFYLALDKKKYNSNILCSISKVNFQKLQRINYSKTG